MKSYLAEFLGTFILVFAGTGAIIVNDISGGAISHFGVAVTFGLVVMAMIYTLGEVSGAHLNPAVSFGFWAARRFPARKLFPYVISQCLGALLASAMLRLLFPQHLSLGMTVPTGTIVQSLALETLLAFFLMFVIINVSVGAKEKGVIAGVAIGGMVALEASFGGPISGASMNPARSLGPAIVSGNLNALWVYLLAPFAGAFLGILGCRCVQQKGCCTNLQEQEG
jgi:MIP family channel proteins